MTKEKNTSLEWETAGEETMVTDICMEELT
jgi:hypothetical protein